jgi:hypothetical protein
MASYSATKSVHKTLTTTTADTVNLNDQWTEIEVINRSGTDPLYVRGDGVTAVAEANETDVVMAGEAVLMNRIPAAGISVVGNGNAYSVIGVG